MCKVNPKIDLVFKKLFGVEKNKDLLLSLVNSILSEDEQISTLTLKNPYNLPDYMDGKISVLDIKAEDENGKQYNIEMQMIGHENYGQRSLYYLAKTYADQLGSSRDYKTLRKTIVINIVNFDFFKQDQTRYHREIVMRDNETFDKYESLDYFGVHFVELKKFDHPHLPIQTTLERWMSFLNRANELEKENLPPELNTNDIKKAVDELNIMYFDKKEREFYERLQIAMMDEAARIRTAENIAKGIGFDEGIKEGIQKGKEIGLEQGKEIGLEQGKEIGLEQGKEIGLEIGLEEGIKMTAKGMKNENLPYSIISKITGLSIEQIEKL